MPQRVRKTTYLDRCNALLKSIQQCAHTNLRHQSALYICPQQYRCDHSIDSKTIVTSHLVAMPCARIHSPSMQTYIRVQHIMDRLLRCLVLRRSSWRGAQRILRRRCSCRRQRSWVVVMHRGDGRPRRTILHRRIRILHRELCAEKQLGQPNQED